MYYVMEGAVIRVGMYITSGYSTSPSYNVSSVFRCFELNNCVIYIRKQQENLMDIIQLMNRFNELLLTPLVILVE